MLTPSTNLTPTGIQTDIWDNVKKQFIFPIRTAIDALGTTNEQVLFTKSLLSSLSSLFTGLHGMYHQRKTYCNCFLIILAPPASGKGLMAGARIALSKIHQHLLTESKVLQAAYKQQVANALKSKTAPPDKPPFSVLFLPGNCTSSKMIEHIRDNGDNPILIFETEASTLASANKSQYGDFSDIVRKAFQGETISYTRKFNNEFVEVNDPRLAIVLSGTPDQIVRLIGTPEDGTFSRYMFYSFDGKDVWQDANRNQGVNITDLLARQQDYYFNLWRYYQGRDVSFDLTDRQWDELNIMFREELTAVASHGNVYGSGVVKRHGLMMFKLCMVLTALRMYELGIMDKQIICTDKDFAIAKYLISVSLDSSLEVLEQLPTPVIHTKPKDKPGKLLTRLPDSFTTVDAVQLSNELNVSERTVYRWLERLVGDGSLQLLQHGMYKKRPV